MSDIEHPAHYNQYEGFEVIDVCKQLGFIRGNVFKYLARAGWKPKGDRDAELKDLRKAAFYIQLEIARVEDEKRKEEEAALVKEITPQTLVDLNTMRQVGVVQENIKRLTKKYCHAWSDTEFVKKYVSKNSGLIVSALQYRGTNYESVFSAYAVSSTVPKTDEYIETITVELPSGKLVGISDGDWLVLGYTPSLTKIWSDRSFCKAHVPEEEYYKEDDR